MIVHVKTAYLDADAVIKKGRYADGSTALCLFDAETGEPLAKATVCLSAIGSRPTDEHHRFIKDYAVNEGMLKALQEAGTIGPPIRRHRNQPRHPDHRRHIVTTPLSPERPERGYLMPIRPTGNDAAMCKISDAQHVHSSTKVLIGRPSRPPSSSASTGAKVLAITPPCSSRQPHRATAPNTLTSSGPSDEA